MQVHSEVKHLVNATVVERYHVDPAAKIAVDYMQMSVSCRWSVQSAVCLHLSDIDQSVSYKNQLTHCVTTGFLCHTIEV